ncbi:cryptococcal mannosyltransferase 1-domain-containing protein [Podospora appendiculata]|uniref:Cryptococcal mannosyltransferase 1-domain-containing protein n=1 Tax=Podospora appendiculata TaxID=314037 RepID=A0AAE0X289_9PEZI|nr:cryptococcal mannosyltransferase 1-domain-containing protein [Podospora appendiculata]
MRRKTLFAWQAACLLLVALTLYLGHDQLARLPRPALFQPPGHQQSRNGSTSPVAKPVEHGILSPENRTAYIQAIMQPNATHLPRLQCPQSDFSRYDYLKRDDGESDSSRIQYLIALDLRECLSLLPRLIGSVVETIRFLGPERCALSIIEGNSPDGTGEVLAALRPELDKLTTTYYFQSSDINPKQGNRIEKLAALRNMAVQPLLDDEEAKKYSPSTTVVFLNDVAICAEDILELAHQRRFLGADMTCAMDWTYVGRDPTFYDVWIARGMTGDSFFEIPASGSWDSAWNLFWNDPGAHARLAAYRPFQVFSCWNGATAFTAAPLLHRQIAFRAAREGECMQGEPQLFCKDLWFHGHGKIAVVPSVSLEYSDEKGRQIKLAKGFTSQWATGLGSDEDKIDWRLEPPAQVKCIPSYEHQFFEAWNKTQPGT